MKHLLALIIFTLAFIYSCGEDNITNNNNGNGNPLERDSLIYELDSLGVATSDTGFVYLSNSDLHHFSNSDTCSMKIVFTGHTNVADTANNFIGMGYTIKYGFDFTSHAIDLFTPEMINRQYSIRLDTIRPNSRILLETVIIRNTQYSYVYFKDVKIYKIVK